MKIKEISHILIKCTSASNYRQVKFITGQPQVIKVVQSTPNKALSGIVSTTNTGGLKVFKAPNQDSQVLTPALHLIYNYGILIQYRGYILPLFLPHI